MQAHDTTLVPIFDPRRFFPIPVTYEALDYMRELDGDTFKVFLAIYCVSAAPGGIRLDLLGISRATALSLDAIQGIIQDLISRRLILVRCNGFDTRWRNPDPPLSYVTNATPPRQRRSPKRDRILARDNHACKYCGATDKPLFLDHVIPRIQGGTNDESNLVACCRSCNSSKGGRRPEEWRPCS